MGGFMGILTGGYRLSEIMNAPLTRLVTLAQLYKSSAAYWGPIATTSGAIACGTASISFLGFLAKQSKLPPDSDGTKHLWDTLIVGSALFSIASVIVWKYASTSHHNANYFRYKSIQRLFTELLD
ncbi:MAG: hypothetical protein K1060chlam2_00002 [Chlamydiae bacterium]|nr:hypothetical protein [Chlamydiota bacterium]